MKLIKRIQKNREKENDRLLISTRSNSFLTTCPYIDVSFICRKTNNQKGMRTEYKSRTEILTREFRKKRTLI